MAETMLPAAPVTTNTVSGPRTMPSPGPVVAGRSSSVTVHRSPSAWPTSTAPGSPSASATSRSATSSGRSAGPTSTAFTSGSGRSRAKALANPVTAPPSGAWAPASS